MMLSTFGFIKLLLSPLLSYQLTSVLREVKYLVMLKNQNIPKAALNLHSQRERLYVVSKCVLMLLAWRLV